MKNIKKIVRNSYGKIAKQNVSCCGNDSCCSGGNLTYDISRGYTDEQLAAVPEGANLGLGCGNPVVLVSIKEGETVLDLGSGAGFDAFLAAKAVGESGKVIGVDMTPEMVEKAKENAQKGNYKNVEFRLGEIEDLPVAGNSIDVVISNCVINLAPNKDRVFQEAYKVLKKGGRLLVSDIVLEEPLASGVKEDMEAYVGCIAGASLKQDYLQTIRNAGFREIKIVESSSWISEDNDTQKAIKSIKVSATK